VQNISNIAVYSTESNLATGKSESVNIQYDIGGKINILGGENIGHCEKKGPYEHVSNSEWLPGNSCWQLQIQKHCEW